MYRKFLLTSVLLFISMVAFAQSRITGYVTDPQGEPIIGANVVIKGTTIGTITDIDGKFSLSTENKSCILKVSFLGYKTKEVAANGQSELKIRLIEDSQALEEVIVVGYGTQSKRNVTGAISSVKSESLSRSASTSTAGALSGKIQGVSTRAMDARPGKGINIEVRNMGNPLFVIDGIPYGGQTGSDWVQSSNVSGNDVFNSLNLEDIESISILKDASASIYGLRASNGVVLVTTKKGNKGEKNKVNVNGYYGWQNLTRFPKMANAGQYVRGLVESEQNNGRDPSALYTREELDKWMAGTEPGYKSYDYYDIVMRKNVPQWHINANVTGGTDKTNHYISVSQTSQDALMKDFSYKRTNIQANVETKILKNLTIGTQISGKYEKSEDVGLPGGDGYFSAILGMFKMWPTESPYANDNPKYINHTHEIPYNPALYRRDIAGYKDNLTRNANINAYAQYDFSFGLTAKATFSYNYTNSKFDGFQYSYDAYTYNKTTDEYKRTGGTDSRWRYQTERDVAARYMQLQLNYAKQLGEHYISAVVAYEASDYEKDYQSQGTSPTNNYLPLLQKSLLNDFNDDWSYEARAGWIGRINYNYQNKYLVELLGRYDGSYLYAAGKRWGFFPGASIGWRISEEPFFKNLKGVVNDLKIRASIGQTGSESGVSMFGYMDGYNWNQGSAVLDGELVTGLNQRGLPIRNLSWVKNTSANIGIDIALFDNRLTATFDAFKKSISGIPAGRYDVKLPSEVGYSLPNENLNKDAYVGALGIVTWSDKIGDLNYTVSANATYSRYKMVSRYKPRYGNSWDQYRNSSEDRWGGVWWGYQVIGRFQSEDEIKNYPVDIDGDRNRTLLPGDFIYKDVNGDGRITDLDERPIGYPQGWSPMLSFGGTIGLEWKGIDLNIDFAGGAMQGWYQDYELRNPYHGNGNSPEYLLEDRWHRADPYDPNSEWIPGYYPAIRKGTTASNNRNSDFWLHNVRYLRIKNLELGYSLPKSIIGKIKAEKIRIYANCSNLCSFDNVHQFGIDPEISANAAVVYPQQRTFLIGFNVTY